MTAPQIIPSILVYSPEEFDQQISTIAPICNFVQIDIVDGQFVEGATWIDPEHVAKHIPMDFELHMMVLHPLEHVRQWKHIDQLKRVIFHYETVDDAREVAKEMKTYGKEVCMCLNPETSVDVLADLYDVLDAVQFMSVHPGKQGQPFLPEAVDRIALTHERYPELPIAADGAVSTETIPALFAAGARRFAPGSAVWKGNPVENYTQLTNLLTALGS